MGNKAFVQFEVNSQIDVTVIQAGISSMISKAQEGYIAAVTELGTATLAGDLNAVAEAKAKIGQFADCLESLGQSVKQANDYASGQAPVEGGEGEA